MSEQSYYINRVLPDAEVEAFVNDLIQQGWAVRTTKEETPGAVDLGTYSSRRKLMNGINRLSAEGYTTFDHYEHEDPVTNQKEWHLEAWKPTVKWRVEAWPMPRGQVAEAA